MTQQPTLTVSAAVEAFQIERRALQKMLSEGRLPGAYKDQRGRWMVPVASLHQANIQARKTWLSDANEFANRSANGANEFANGAFKSNENKGSDANEFANETDNDANDLRAHIALLQVQLDAEKEKNEHLRDNLSDIRRAMLMLESGQPRPLDDSEELAKPEPRRRWWQRRK